MQTEITTTTTTRSSIHTAAMPTETPDTLVIHTSEWAERFRARVYQMPSGTIVTVPVQEGSRGPLYTAQLTRTKHGLLRTTKHTYHLTFDIPCSEGPLHAARCLDSEIGHFIDFLQRYV